MVAIPENHRVNILVADPALLVLLVKEVPLARPWHIAFVTEHPGEDKLVICYVWVVEVAH